MYFLKNICCCFFCFFYYYYYFILYVIVMAFVLLEILLWIFFMKCILKVGPKRSVIVHTVSAFMLLLLFTICLSYAFRGRLLKNKTKNSFVNPLPFLCIYFFYSLRRVAIRVSSTKRSLCYDHRKVSDELLPSQQ